MKKDENVPKPKIDRKQIKRKVEDLKLPAQEKLHAVAVKYDVKKDRAPKIVATGRGRIAEDILKLAEENEVPFYEDKLLGELLGKLQFDEEIPPELYAVVAEVLAFVYQLNKLSKQQQVKGKGKRKGKQVVIKKKGNK